MMRTLVSLLAVAALSVSGQQCGKVAKEPTKLNSNGMVDGNGVQHNHQGIINGETVEHGSVPWQAKLFFKNATHQGQGSFCGGSLISKDWVVTAAHCMTHPADSIGVQFGAFTQRNMNEANSITCRVSKVIKHENYEKGGFAANDVALMKLTNCNKRMQFSSTIQPICLPNKSNNFANPAYYAMVSGWGRTVGLKNQDTAAQLQKTVLRMETHQRCKSVYRNQLSDFGSLCASGKKGQKITVTCQGDSGGPLALRTPQGQWLLAGIVSFGPEGCQRPGFPAVFAHVPSYVDWIVNKMRAN